jgi:hypothetical protein
MRSSRHTTLRLILLLIVAVPAFSGFPLGRWPQTIVTGVPWSLVCYLAVVHALLVLVLGRRIAANITAAAAMITLPVVFGGAAVNALFAAVTLNQPVADGSHYVRLALTMLTMIPLALALVALIPFGGLEQRLMFRPSGVGALQKKCLMALRVFQHIAFAVIPNTVEVLREERGVFEPGSAAGRRAAWRRLEQVAVAVICASLQPIGLWACEIAGLPEALEDVSPQTFLNRK